MFALAASSAVAHDLTYALKESEIKYSFRGEVVSSYVGGIHAPPSRQVEITGTYVLKTEKRASGKWVVMGLTKGLNATKSGKPLAKDEAELPLRGIWTQVLGGESMYTSNGVAVLPSVLNAPLWPIAWMPLSPEKSLTIGEEFTQQFDFPLQSFMEDDPLGRISVPLVYVFNGPEHIGSETYSVFLRTVEEIDKPVKHPEDPNLNLRGKIMIDGRFSIARGDGRIESASVIMGVELALQGPKYPFGFSKARASVTANLQRIKE